ncbi:MAG: dTDP-glucose 4,6-dehydratase [bacterium]|nr:dTDP-glucose 4,6-dehydratase [bacterium]
MIDLNTSRVLVTGGAGFIGSNFVLYLLKKYPGAKVVNLDKLTYAGNLENLKSVEGDARYSFVKGDITDAKLVSRVMEGVDVVVHFAAETHVDRSIMKPADFVLTNVVGTQVLLDAAVNHKVKRFHHISTDEVFGSLPLDPAMKFSEDSPLKPSSPYSASKAGSDLLVRAYSKTFGLPITITNTSNNYGPYQFPEKLIPLAITNLLEDKKVPVYGQGVNVRDWIWVEDHCRGIDSAITKGRAGETYCLGGPEDMISNLEVVKKILAIMNKGEEYIEFVKDRPGHDLRYAIDSSKAEKELGYQPTIKLDEGLEMAVKWYVENKDWWARIKSGQYQDYYRAQYDSR